MSAGMRPSNQRWALGLLIFWAGVNILAGPDTHAQTAPVATSAAPIQLAAENKEPALRGNADRGKTLYQNCTSCHSIDEDDIGPRHRGVVGRKAGTSPEYAYSPALKASGLVWNEANLDRWLTNPSAMVPGTKMFFLIKDPQDRADIIAYLAGLK